MQDRFDQKKESILLEIAATLANSPDASPKGSIDEICIPIMNLINNSKDMVTTSSCSGRVSVFLEGIKNVADGDMKIGSKGNEGKWIFVTHQPDDLNNWYDSINFEFDTRVETDLNTRYILYKFEPLILHVKCRDDQTAQDLYNCAMGCGFRESGIGSNGNVAIRISIKLDIPIGYLYQDRYILVVDKQYLKLITDLSLNRFTENFKKLNHLYDSIEAMINREKVNSVVETKEQRRQRKIQEGMARKLSIQRQKNEKADKHENADKHEQEEKHEKQDLEAN